MELTLLEPPTQETENRPGADDAGAAPKDAAPLAGAPPTYGLDPTAGDHPDVYCSDVVVAEAAAIKDGAPAGDASASSVEVAGS